MNIIYFRISKIKTIFIYKSLKNKIWKKYNKIQIIEINI